MVVDVGGAAPHHWEVEDSPLVWLVAFAGVCLEKMFVFFSACGVCLWEDSRLLPAVPPTHSGCF